MPRSRSSKLGNDAKDTASLAASLAQITTKADVAEINLESFRTSGLSDADTLINAIAGSVGKRIKFPFNKTYTIDKNIRIPASDVEVDLNGSTLDFSTYSGSRAIEIIPSSSGKLRLFNCLTNGTIKGKATTTTTTDGVFIGRPSDLITGVTSHLNFNNVFIDGFRDNLVIGSQGYILTFNNLICIHHARYPVNFQTVSNAGENIRFFGGTISNGLTGSDGVFCDININPDVYFHSTSFDYSEKLFNVKGGHWMLYGCHLENNNNNPMIKVTFTPGNSPISFGIFGGGMGTGPGTDSGSPEQANGRPWFIELSGDKITFTMENVSTYLYDKSSEIVHVTSGLPQVSVRSPHISPKGGNSPDICGYLNQLWNGDFESSTDLQGWTQFTNVNYTISTDTSTFYSGTKSLKITSTASTASVAIAQDLTGLSAGKMLLLTGYLKSAITNGYVAIRLQHYNVKGDLVLDETLAVGVGQVTGTTDWTRIGIGKTVGAGVSKITMSVYANSINGTVWADKMQAWVV